MPSDSAISTSAGASSTKATSTPPIDLTDRPNLRIAELAADHCLCAIQVADEYPHAHVDASDISLSLMPAIPDLPSNLSVTKWSFFDPVPEEWKGAFDLLHVRLIIQPFGGNQDPRPVLDRFMSMLKPGGYIQWDEYDYHDAEKNNVYIANDPVKIPNPEITHNSSTEIWRLMTKTFQWPSEHFDILEDYCTTAGLVDVVAHRKRPPPSVFRAFFEHWYALCAQLLPLLESKDVEVGLQARALILQMKRNAAVDGVYSAHITKMVIGKKPAANE